jgi:hypothetical protein
VRCTPILRQAEERELTAKPRPAVRLLRPAISPARVGALNRLAQLKQPVSVAPSPEGVCG